MNLPGFLAAAVVIAVVVTVVVLSFLSQRFFHLYRFRRSAESLPSGTLPEDPADAFPRNSAYGRMATRFIQSFARAEAGHVLSSFNVDRQLGSLAQTLRTSASSFRASAGLLILMALVITLLNLQGAVSRLGLTFSRLSPAGQTQSDEAEQRKVVDDVQGAMADVAAIASHAFQVSGVTVLGALLLLSGGLAVDVEARRALRIFLLWAHETYAARIAETASRGGTDQKVDFSEAIGHFKALVDSFAGVTEELSVLGDFRSELGGAVKTISEAVDRLPDTIQANMSTLSTQVTREIADDLTRQYELLKKLLMTYADLGLTVKKVEEFNERLVNQNAAAADAIAKLGSIPEDAYRLGSVSLSLAGVISELSRKVNEIPTLDIKATHSGLSSLDQKINGLGSSLDAARHSMETRDGFIDGALKELRRQTADLAAQQPNVQRATVETIRAELNRLQVRLDGMDSGIRSSYQLQMTQIQEQLRQLQNRNILDLFRGHRGT